ncbi:restriction endonuclease [Streptomyces sp. MK7]|uniref:restriction endonuclease n=1 Tax=Streptomyces sp. MK7 TaxID=3067635 RepID=UPI00292D284C|nr:restriction endonuclease [Streptomyces sp. MK7]
MLVEIHLPPEAIVPTARGYRYVKNRDETTVLPRPEKERKEIYASVLAQVALRTVHEVLTSDPDRVVNGVILNRHVRTIDRATGQEVSPCLVTLSASREQFGKLRLSQVDSAQCLRGLNALVSPNPYDLEPIRPIVEFDLSKYRLMDSMDVVAGLDSRPVLVKLTPTEFEHLIRQLFEAIGMEAWNTQASKDEGVDAVAVSKDPVFNGECFIQAKRYSKLVGVESVQALAGVVEHKRAAKGVLITTSWFGRASHDFAPPTWPTPAHRRAGTEVPDQGTPWQGCDPGPGPAEEAPLALRPADRPHRPRSWAVPGPSEVARQWPMTTNDDHQEHEPTAPHQQ